MTNKKRTIVCMQRKADETSSRNRLIRVFIYDPHISLCYIASREQHCVSELVRLREDV